MVVFGPYRALPERSSLDFVIFNLTSPTNYIPRLYGLIPPFGIESNDEEYIKQVFDRKYYDYLFNDPTALDSVMIIMDKIFNGRNVFICIADYISSEFYSLVNESFMKVLQTRYDLRYHIIETMQDIYDIDPDEQVFATSRGLKQYDEDILNYEKIKIKQKIVSR